MIIILIDGQPVKLHPSITPERVMAACESRLQEMENPGFCLSCGDESSDCEPDATNYVCESCRRPDVFGAEEILLRMPT